MSEDEYDVIVGLLGAILAAVVVLVLLTVWAAYCPNGPAGCGELRP